jgi:hypothetical protein
MRTPKLPALLRSLDESTERLGELYSSREAWQKEISSLEREGQEELVDILRSGGALCLRIAVDVEADLRNYGLQGTSEVD